MDGKDDAENLISDILKDPELLKSLMSAPKKDKEVEAETVEAN